MSTQNITVEDGIFIICRDTNTDIMIEHIVGEKNLGELANLGDSPKNPSDKLHFLVVKENQDLAQSKEEIEEEYKKFEKKTMYTKDKKVRGRKRKKDKEEEEN